MKKNKTIIGSALLVMIVVLGSKVLGFLRQMVIAATYGSDISTDIYFLSSDFIIGVSGALLASLSTALVTVYIGITVQQSREKANQTASKMLTLFLATGGVFVLLLNIFAPFVARMLAPSYTNEALRTLTDYLRFFSIAFIFTAFQSVYAAVLNADNSFVPGKLYGMLYNPIAILFVLLFADKLGIKALMAAYVVGNLLHTLCLKFFSRNTFKFSLSKALFDKNVGQLLMLTFPLLLSNLSVQLNNIVDKSICSLLGEGFASSYSYAYTLEQFITATVTATLSLVLLSRYSTYAAEGDTEKLIKTFKNSLGGMIILLVPITVIVAVMSYDIVSIVYLRGEFTADNALHTSHALLGLCIGFSLIAVREMYVRLSFAYQNTKTPMIANLLAVILNLVLSLVLYRYLGIFGVTVATSLCVILTIVILNKSVRQYIPDFKFTSILPLILKVFISSAVCLITAIVMKKVIPFDAIVRFIICTVTSLSAYLACLLALRCDELNQLIGELRLQIANKFDK